MICSNCPKSLPLLKFRYWSLSISTVQNKTRLGHLDAPMNAAGAVFHKFHCPTRIATADEVGNDQLRIGVDPYPSSTHRPKYRTS